jgi:transposase
MLWDEYIERCPEGYRYSRFCELDRNWASRLSVTMRQAHIGGDELFVDYAGDTVPYRSAPSGADFCRRPVGSRSMEHPAP